MLACALVRGEEECFVFLDWAAEEAAEDIPRQDGASYAGGVQKWIVGIERPVAKILIGPAMEIVAATLRHRLNVTTA